MHDLRRTFASQLAELGIDRLTISKILNHSERGVTGTVYELSEHWEKKRVAMLAWADKLAEITGGQPAASNVATLKPRFARRSASPGAASLCAASSSVAAKASGPLGGAEES